MLRFVHVINYNKWCTSSEIDERVECYRFHSAAAFFLFLCIYISPIASKAFGCENNYAHKIEEIETNIPHYKRHQFAFIRHSIRSASDKQSDVVMQMLCWCLLIFG